MHGRGGHDHVLSGRRGHVLSDPRGRAHYDRRDVRGKTSSQVSCREDGKRAMPDRHGHNVVHVDGVMLTDAGDVRTRLQGAPSGELSCLMRALNQVL